MLIFSNVGYSLKKENNNKKKKKRETRLPGYKTGILWDRSYKVFGENFEEYLSQNSQFGKALK